MNGKEFAASLRWVAEWYDRHPEIPAPPSLCLNVYPGDDPDVIERIARALGRARKRVGGLSDELFVLSHQFGGISLDFVWLRSAVCTRTVVGTEEVPERVIPAFTREIVKWDCGSLLRGGDDVQEQA